MARQSLSIALPDAVGFPVRQIADRTDTRREAIPVSRSFGIEENRVAAETSESAVYFDGSCALCKAEIGYYRREDKAGSLCFVDISDGGATPPHGVSRTLAMARFHVRAKDGRLLSGAAAFVEVWSRLPGWRWAARAASLPGALTILELAYRMFLPVRPFISRLVGRTRRSEPGDGGTRRP